VVIPCGSPPPPAARRRRRLCGVSSARARKVAVVPSEKCYRMPFHHKERDPVKAANDPYPVHCDQYWNDT